MHMVFHDGKICNVEVVFLSYSLEDLFKVAAYLPTQYPSPVFGYPDQMVFQFVDRMGTSPKSHAHLYSMRELEKQ